MLAWRKRLVWVFVAALPLGACIGPDSPPSDPSEYSEDARLAYDDALREYFDRDWELAVPMFEEIQRRYAYSRYARLAQLRIADADFEQQNFAEAAAGYRAFSRDFPNDPEVPYARFKTAKSLFEDRSESILMPPLEERDLVTIHDALQVTQSLLRDYPGYKRVPELEYMERVELGLLARHELYVARFYLIEGNFEAAVARIQYALTNCAGSGLDAEAMVLLGETQLKLQQDAEARETFEALLAKYPESAFTVAARRFLARMAPQAAQGAEPTNTHPPAG